MPESPLTSPPDPALTEAHKRSELDRSLASGIAWTGGVKWLAQIVTWGTTLVVARLLTPEDFGIIGMATLVLGFIRLINEFGLGAVIVQRKEVDEPLLSHLGAFALALGSFFSLCGIALAAPIALFFSEPRVLLVVVALSLNFTITAPAIVSRSMLTRHLQFRTLALIDGANGIVTSLLTVLLAWMGWGYWALVAGALVSHVGSTTAYLVLRPFRPRWPRPLSLISRELQFGGHLVGSRIAWYAYEKADFAVVGRVLGTAPLGAYNIGWTLASLPVEKISALIMHVTPPIFAKVQDQPAELRRYLRLLTEGIANLTFPVGVGMALVAPDFVPLVLGDQWASAVPPLQLLALYGGFRSIVPFFSQILIATDHARLNMWFSVLGVVFLVPAFVIGSRWGITGVALAWVAVYPALVVSFHLPTTFRIIGMPVGEYLRSLWPAVSSSGVMALAVYGVQLLLAVDGASWISLGSAVAAGVFAYAGCLLTLHRERVQMTLGFIRKLRKKT